MEFLWGKQLDLNTSNFRGYLWGKRSIFYFWTNLSVITFVQTCFTHLLLAEWMGSLVLISFFPVLDNSMSSIITKITWCVPFAEFHCSVRSGSLGSVAQVSGGFIVLIAVGMFSWWHEAGWGGLSYCLYGPNCFKLLWQICPRYL